MDGLSIFGGPANAWVSEAIGLLGRSILGASAIGVGAALSPSWTSGTDTGFPLPPSGDPAHAGWAPAPLGPLNRAISDVVLHGGRLGGGQVYVMGGSDRFVPRIGWASGGWDAPLGDFASPPTVQGEIAEPLPPGFFDERSGYTPAAQEYLSATEADWWRNYWRTRGIDWVNPGHHATKGRVTVIPKVIQPSLPDLERTVVSLPDMELPRVMTPREQILRLKVEALDRGVVFSVRFGSEDMKKRERPRRDTKAQEKRLIGKLQRIVTATYGTVSELGDVAEVFSWSLYGRTASGKVLPAMALEHGSMLGVLEGYLAGDYRLDAVGFAVDLAMNQGFEDYAVGYASRLEIAAASRLGGSAGYRADRLFRSQQQASGESYVSPLVQSASDWLSGHLDPVRSQRVQRLW